MRIKITVLAVLLATIIAVDGTHQAAAQAPPGITVVGRVLNTVNFIQNGSVVEVAVLVNTLGGEVQLRCLGSNIPYCDALVAGWCTTSSIQWRGFNGAYELGEMVIITISRTPTSC
jgi:hypothetical protein